MIGHITGNKTGKPTKGNIQLRNPLIVSFVSKDLRVKGNGRRTKGFIQVQSPSTVSFVQEHLPVKQDGGHMKGPTQGRNRFSVGCVQKPTAANQNARHTKGHTSKCTGLNLIKSSFRDGHTSGNRTANSKKWLLQLSNLELDTVCSEAKIQLLHLLMRPVKN